MRDTTSRSASAQARAKCRRGPRSDLARILETLPEIQEELCEHRRLLEILTACQTPDGAQRGERGPRL
jgi:hypothetical protein